MVPVCITFPTAISALISLASVQGAWPKCPPPPPFIAQYPIFVHASLRNLEMGPGIRHWVGGPYTRKRWNRTRV